MGVWDPLTASLTPYFTSLSDGVSLDLARLYPKRDRGSNPPEDPDSDGVELWNASQGGLVSSKIRTPQNKHFSVRGVHKS